MRDAGWENLLFLTAGAVYCLRERKKSFFMGMGVIFLICTSALPLHWERWGMPVYAFLILGTALGISYAFDLLYAKGRQAAGKAVWVLRIVTGMLFAVVVCNYVISGILAAQSALTTEARVDAVRFCREKGITARNTLYDGYSPFALDSPATLPVELDGEGNVTVPEGIRYLIMSSKMYGRYYEEPERYSGQTALYDAVQEQCTPLYEEGGAYYEHSSLAFKNVVYGVVGLIRHNRDTLNGSVIKIYEVSNRAG